MNKVILMGRLTRDPEVRYGQSGDAKGENGLIFPSGSRIFGCAFRAYAGSRGR